MSRGDDGEPVVETADFLELVAAFDEAQDNRSSTERWPIGRALDEFGMASVPNTAWGGDLAVAYADGGLAGVNLLRAQDLLREPSFASEPQALRGQTWLRQPGTML